MLCGKNCEIPHRLLRYGKCWSLRIRIIYFGKVSIAYLANRSAVWLFEQVIMALLSAERYSEPSQTSEMELFTKTVNGLKPLTIFAKKIHIKCVPSRSSHRRCSVKKVFLEILQSSQENICARVSLLIT